MVRPGLAALLVAASLAVSACGSDEPEPTGGGAPAITAPGRGIASEDGGGDGSGADGRNDANPRGGIAAGPDSPAPSDDTGAGGGGE